MLPKAPPPPPGPRWRVAIMAPRSKTSWEFQPQTRLTQYLHIYTLQCAITPIAWHAAIPACQANQ